jgi:hypothetical protein
MFLYVPTFNVCTSTVAGAPVRFVWAVPTILHFLTNLVHSIPHVRGIHRHTMSFPLECIEENIQQCHKFLRGDSIVALYNRM